MLSGPVLQAEQLVGGDFLTDAPSEFTQNIR